MVETNERLTAADQLVRLIFEINPMQKKFIEDSLNTLEIGDREDFQNYLDYCKSKGISNKLLAESYDLIVKDTFSEQIYFQKHKKYRYSTYAEVAQSVYHNPEYMTKYMLGLALSAFLWPNHRELHKFFIKNLPKNRHGKYLEIGPGHGYYFLQAMKTSSFDSFIGIDISETSINMTKDIVSSGFFGSFSNYQLVLRNFFEWKGEEKFDFLVMAEVLEHVEDPLAFLKKLNELSAPGAKVFITTCINAPAIDHIYLYCNTESLEAQFIEANFAITSKLIVPYKNMSIENSMKKQLPVNVAYLLEPKQ